MWPGGLEHPLALNDLLRPQQGKYCLDLAAAFGLSDVAHHDYIDFTENLLLYSRRFSVCRGESMNATRFTGSTLLHSVDYGLLQEEGSAARKGDRFSRAA